MAGQETETTQQLEDVTETENTKDDTNSSNGVNQENNIVKKDSDDNIVKPAPLISEETKDDTGDPTNKDPTARADGESEDLTETKAPDTTHSPTLGSVNAEQVDGVTGGPDARPHPDEDKPKDNIVKKDMDENIIKPDAPTNEETKDDTGELAAAVADVKNYERSPEHESSQPETSDTNDTAEVMHNQGLPVETIRSVSLENVDNTGFLRGKWGLLTAVAVVVVAALLAVYLMPSSPPETPPEESNVDVFLRQLEKVKAQFLNQRAELWKRSKIHLQRQLQTAHPTAPVSLILTAGLRAEKTMHCLARGLASSLSLALNASVLHINGTSVANQESNQVKLDIDLKLQRAFEGDKPVAIIHRFDELPPGSTLIFYRYCDHENAAYKETFLIFTVLLEEEEIPPKIHLNAVEEMVDDHLKKKFLSHDHPVSFDRMDIDKYGGLWSRISHLVLPVAAVDRIEHEGCQG